MPQETEPDGPDRYGLVLADSAGERSTGLLIPRDLPSEFVHQALLFPVPRAPVRLRGMIQVRGQAVMAIDTGPQPDSRPPVIGRCNVLVLGNGQQAVGLIVQQAPLAVTGLTLCDPAPPVAIEWLAPALRQAWYQGNKDIEGIEGKPDKADKADKDARTGVRTCWHEFSLEKLVDLCLFELGAAQADELQP